VSQGFAREARIGVDLHVGETLYFTSNDTFEKADYPGLYGVRVRACGGGGAGGGANTTGAGQAAVGGGGGGGGYAESVILASALASSETVTVGAGGVFGVSAAGHSSFGSHVQGNGGGVGSTSSAITTSNIGANPGSGGGGTGDLVVAGGSGFSGPLFNNSVLTGKGGTSFLGAGANATRTISGTNGNNAPAGSIGGGGAGGANTSSQGTSRDGGDGAAGIVIVEVLYERKIAVDEDIHTQYLNDTRHNGAHSAGRWVRQTSNQTIATGSLVTVIFNGVTFTADPNSDYTINSSTGVLTFNNAGVYNLACGVRMGSSSANTAAMYMYINDSTIVAANVTEYEATGPIMTITTVWQAAANDNVRVKVFHDIGSDGIVVPGDRTYLSAFRVSD
jgi:hypothetical protein